MKTLQDRTAVVTGGGKGIGMGICRQLAKAGANVVINYSVSEAGALKIKQEIEEMGGEAITYRCDVSDETQVQAMMKAAYEWKGRLDILVNNAALQTNINTLDQYDPESYQQLINVNVRGYYLCMREAASYMKRQNKGVVLFISSIHAKIPTQFDPAYCMSKGGLKMLEREAAIELPEYGIRVMCIEPGAVTIDAPKSGNKSPIRDPGMMDLFAEKRYFPSSKTHKLGRIPLPDDVGKLAAFLVSDDAEMLNGFEMIMDTGAWLY